MNKKCDKICNRDCFYFPNTPSEVKKEYIDSNGLKHREATFLCGYDEHIITKYAKCNNYYKIKV